ncbi:GerMN domain-containing protein [Amycolatopsis sp. FDAARGOS 1241]|uniref:GerMN domain-containing protein n=1 Tax=Amycolatopsis sp. FDAARGOS 1241 TaxID=2778070 RepID=UPI00194F2BD6|nr:GerMN domain-containing protein [Amycolatopsis sp. FDAARGOS 1241]QRP43553.1 GerMN domain-containing protein [Amycolatopsis sp. FDAARGOS 1241]
MSRQVAAAILLVALTATACGVRPSAAISGGDPPSGPAEPTVDQAHDTIYLVADGSLRLATRDGANLTGAAAINALAQGPSPAEQADGLTTEVPRSVVPATVLASAGGTVVQLSSSVTALSDLAVRQIVCTLRNQRPPGARFILTGGGETRGPEACN